MLNPCLHRVTSRYKAALLSSLKSKRATRSGQTGPVDRSQFPRLADSNNRSRNVAQCKRTPAKSHRNASLGITFYSPRPPQTKLIHDSTSIRWHRRHLKVYSLLPTSYPMFSCMNSNKHAQHIQLNLNSLPGFFGQKIWVITLSLCFFSYTEIETTFLLLFYFIPTPFTVTHLTLNWCLSMLEIPNRVLTFWMHHKARRGLNFRLSSQTLVCLSSSQTFLHVSHQKQLIHHLFLWH